MHLLCQPHLLFVGDLLKLVVPKRSGATYADFDNAWFFNVGTALAMTMAIQNLTPPSIQLMKTILLTGKQNGAINATERLMNIDKTDESGKPVNRCCCGLMSTPKCCIRKFYGACCGWHTLVGPKYTQESIDESVEGPEFDMAACYGEAYLLIFVSLIYSTGLPILLFFACIGFTYKYFVDKYALLNLYRSPPMYGAQFAKTTETLFPVAILLHMAFGIWLLSAPNKDELPGFSARFSQKHVLPSIALMITTIALLFGRSILQWILDHTETPCEKAWEERKQRKIHAAAAELHSDDDEDELLPFTEAFYLEPGKKGAFLARCLTSYAIQDNPLYADAFEHLEPSEYGRLCEVRKQANKTPRGERPTTAEVMAQMQKDDLEAPTPADDGNAQADSPEGQEESRNITPEPPKGEKGEVFERKAPEKIGGKLPSLAKPGKGAPKLPPLDTKALGLNP
eukprot:SAG31_NODE_198_length_20656_cov_5.167291_16_plen_454_part_00